MHSKDVTHFSMIAPIYSIGLACPDALQYYYNCAKLKTQSFSVYQYKSIPFNPKTIMELE